MGKLVIDGNRVYTVDEACMKRKNLTLEQIRQKETGGLYQQQENRGRGSRQNHNR